MWLLNHAEEMLHAPAYARPSQYGPGVQHALFLAWNAANRICAKRLIPLLPTLIDSLERHGRLQLTEEIRSQLLSMSAATADRLLRPQCKTSPRGLSTTRAGTLLKQQVPIHPEDSLPCTRSRRRENESWAGGGPTKPPSRERITSWLMANPEREPRRHFQ